MPDVLVTALGAVVVAALTVLAARLATLERRINKLDSENDHLWLWARRLHDLYYHPRLGMTCDPMWSEVDIDRMSTHTHTAPTHPDTRGDLTWRSLAEQLGFQTAGELQTFLDLDQAECGDDNAIVPEHIEHVARISAETPEL